MTAFDIDLEGRYVASEHVFEPECERCGREYRFAMLLAGAPSREFRRVEMLYAASDRLCPACKAQP